MQLEKENHNPNTHHPYFACKNRDEKTPLCAGHPHDVGRLFCEDCLRYDVCAKCIDGHATHRVHRFKSFEESKEATKELLLIEVEQTLNRLKSRENELKNQV
jgi:hypothetical protein